ncbi:hypothetical protein B7463_g5416, partial [Scytalidium lignicola]
MAGGVAGIISVHNDSRSVIITTIILNNIGISPLLMAMLGLLKTVDSKMPSPISSQLFRLAYLPSMIGLILAVVGGIDSSSTKASEVSEGSKFTKIGVALFIIALVLYSFLAASMVPKRRYLESGERVLHAAVLLGVPFIGVRILFSALVAFKKDPDTFSLIINTDKVVIIEGLMTLLPEVIVEALYLFAGFRLPNNLGAHRSQPLDRTEYLRPMGVPHDTDHSEVEEYHAMMATDNRYDRAMLGPVEQYDPISSPSKYVRVSS